MIICLYLEQLIFANKIFTSQFLYTTVENCHGDLFSEILSRENTLHAEINGYCQGISARLPIHWHI